MTTLKMLLRWRISTNVDCLPSTHMVLILTLSTFSKKKTQGLALLRYTSHPYLIASQCIFTYAYII